MQSRYYDPAIGRFLNADIYTSTGQGVVGFNMFAYCLNNPSNRTDAMGAISLWIYLIADSDMGFIHRAVVDHIGDNYFGIKTEYTFNYYGRGDVVDLDARAVWEVKHAGIDPALRAASAALQAYSYTLLNEEVNCLGQAHAFSGTFYIQCGNFSYEVSYDTPYDGVILYTIKEVYNYKGNYFRIYERKTKKKENVQMRTIPHYYAESSYSFSGSGGGGMMNPFVVIGCCGCCFLLQAWNYS